MIFVLINCGPVELYYITILLISLRELESLGLIKLKVEAKESIK
jgi:hypothetical protein